MDSQPASKQFLRSSGSYRALSLAVAAALSGASAFVSAGAAGPTSYAAIAHATPLPHGDAVLGALSMKQPIHVEVALKLRNKAALDALIAAATNRSKGVMSAPMTTAQFLADHAPTQQQAQAVAAYLTSMGFRNVTIAPNRLLVSADGTALTAGVAFQTSFAQVRTQDGRTTYANTQDAHVPFQLKDTVLAVIGLQDVQRPQAAVQRMDAAHTMAHPRVGHNPMEYSSIYGGTGVATAAGVTIGLITQGDLTQTIADLNTFTTQNSLATVTTQTVNTGGTGSDTSKTATWDVESQDIVGMAGGQVGKLVFYDVPTLTDASLTSDLNEAVSANAAKIVSVAFSECETTAQSDGSAAADDTILETAIAQGQTFAVAAGDIGADECGNGGLTPSWPASSQYVVAIGGTSLVATTTAWESESVWGYTTGGASGATGGSPSTFEPAPSWQSIWVSPITTRGVPDVAFEADPNSGAKIIVNGSSSQVGGTALSTALFAGSWGRVLATRGTTLGFAGPMLYSLWYSGDLHDINGASLCNSVALQQGPAYCATVGYDFASGRGSIILNKAIRHLGVSFDHSPVANFSYSTTLNVATDQSVTSLTDLSTDSDDAIASYSWNFGDGSTSTLRNPTHTFPTSSDNWPVTETATDSHGVASSPKLMSVSIPLITQLIGDLGFETDFRHQSIPWVESQGVITNSTQEAPHGGSWYAWLGGKGTAQAESLWQQVAIPAGKTSAVLQFYLHIDTAETTTKLIDDHLIVRVMDSSGNQLAQLVEYSNLNAAPGYTAHNFDLSPYIGQTVRIQFTGNENASLQTSFVLDDITLNVQ